MDGRGFREGARFSEEGGFSRGTGFRGQVSGGQVFRRQVSRGVRFFKERAFEGQILEGRGLSRAISRERFCGVSGFPVGAEVSGGRFHGGGFACFRVDGGVVAFFGPSIREDRFRSDEVFRGAATIREESEEFRKNGRSETRLKGGSEVFS